MSNRSLFSSAGKGPKQPKPHHDLLSGGGAGGRPYMNARAAQSCSEGPSERFSPSQASFIGPFSPIAPVVTPADSDVRKSTACESTPSYPHGVPACISPQDLTAETKLKRSADDDGQMCDSKIGKANPFTERTLLNNAIEIKSYHRQALQMNSNSTRSSVPPPPSYESPTNVVGEAKMHFAAHAPTDKIVQDAVEEAEVYEDYLLEQAGLDDSVFNHESLLETAQVAPARAQQTTSREIHSDLPRGGPSSTQGHGEGHEEALEGNHDTNNTHHTQQQADCPIVHRDTLDLAKAKRNETYKGLLKRLSDMQKDIIDMVE